MEIIYAPKGILQINDARIIFRNFEGVGGKYNREGDRNFSVIIPNEEMANDLIAEGWNVKIKPPRNEGDTPFMYMPVKVKFNDYGPNIYVRTGKRTSRIYESEVKRLDRIDILSCDMDLRPYNWDHDGEAGRSAYLQGMYVIQKIDRFGERYANELEEESEEVLF